MFNSRLNYLIDVSYSDLRQEIYISTIENHSLFNIQLSDLDDDQLDEVNENIESGSLKKYIIDEYDYMISDMLDQYDEGLNFNIYKFVKDNLNIKGIFYRIKNAIISDDNFDSDNTYIDYIVNTFISNNMNFKDQLDQLINKFNIDLDDDLDSDIEYQVKNDLIDEFCENLSDFLDLINDKYFNLDIRFNISWIDDQLELTFSLANDFIFPEILENIKFKGTDQDIECCLIESYACKIMLDDLENDCYIISYQDIDDGRFYYNYLYSNEAEFKNDFNDLDDHEGVFSFVGVENKKEYQDECYSDLNFLQDINQYESRYFNQYFDVSNMNQVLLNSIPADLKNKIISEILADDIND